MKLITFRSVLVLGLLLGAFAVATRAQTEPMAGAYSDLSVRSKEAKTAAGVSIKKYSSTHSKDHVTLVKILKAERQVVAGMNYRICMVVKNRNGVRRTVTTIVYQPPNRSMRSTAWETGSCKDI